MTDCEINEIKVVEADLTRHKVMTTENGEMIHAAEGHIVIFDNIGKYMIQGS